MSKYILQLCSILAGMSQISCFLAYDCQHPMVNSTILSSLEVGPCIYTKPPINITKEKIYLLQTAETMPIHVFQCKISVVQIINHCGMHSHNSLVSGGYQSYIKDITQEACLGIHQTGYLNLGNHIVSNIKPNSTQKIEHIAAGSLDATGACTTGTYSYMGQTWKDVVVMLYYSISISDYETIAYTDLNKVILKSGTTCKYLDNTCEDIEAGRTYWTSAPDSACIKLKYEVLYHGVAEKAIIYEGHMEKIICSVNDDNMVFALTIVRPVLVCMTKAFQTEHSRLIIALEDGMDYGFSKTNIIPSNIDMFAYTNSKFVYIERHIRTQMTNLYYDIVHQKCELERDVLQTQLSMASIAPDEFAYLRMKSPGYTAQILGEVIHIIKCQAVEVSNRATDKCFSELPVYYNNQTYYMTPKNHLLTKLATETECSAIMKPQYKLMDHWYGLAPSLHSVPTPPILKPDTKLQWSYIEPGKLSSAGIYSLSELEAYRRQIMYPTEKEAVSNTISRLIIDSNTDTQHMSIHRLIDQEQIKITVTNYLNKIWGFVIGMGQVANGMIGMYLCFRIGKFLIDTVIHAYSLYFVYGLSWKLLGMFWDTITYCLLHHELKDQKPENPSQASTQDQNSSPLIDQPHPASEHVKISFPTPMKLYPTVRVSPD